MGKTFKKSELDLDNVLVDCHFVLKGKVQEIHIYTSAAEACEFVDYMNENPAFKSHSRIIKDQFKNKFYSFQDYKKRRSVVINIQDIKCFSIPFFIDDGEKFEAKLLQFK